MTDPVTREEMHTLRAAVADNSRRIDATQSTATGLAVLSVQVAEVVKDLGTLTSELAHYRDSHQRQHDAAAAARASSRRWALGLAVAALASLWAPLVYLIGHVR